MIDQWIPGEEEQVTIDPRTKSKTIHAGLNYPDGSDGFIIIGRIGNTAWEPTKVIKKVLIEYYDEPKISVTTDGDSVSDGGDKGGELADGEQANGLGQGNSVSNRKTSRRSKKGGQDSGANVGA